MYLDDELVITVGDTIQYEDIISGEVVDGEVIEILEEFDMVRVLPTSKLLIIPEWINAEDILSEDDIEYVVE